MKQTTKGQVLQVLRRKVGPSGHIRRTYPYTLSAGTFTERGFVPAKSIFPCWSYEGLLKEVNKL